MAFDRSESIQRSATEFPDSTRISHKSTVQDRAPCGTPANLSPTACVDNGAKSISAERNLGKAVRKTTFKANGNHREIC